MPAAASSLRRLSSRSNSVCCVVMAARSLHGRDDAENFKYLWLDLDRLSAEEQRRLFERD
jgi:hypothetical protein